MFDDGDVRVVTSFHTPDSISCFSSHSMCARDYTLSALELDIRGLLAQITNPQLLGSWDLSKQKSLSTDIFCQQGLLSYSLIEYIPLIMRSGCSKLINITLTYRQLELRLQDQAVNRELILGAAEHNSANSTLSIWVVSDITPWQHVNLNLRVYQTRI
jgi:hypothetical protein